MSTDFLVSNALSHVKPICLVQHSFAYWQNLLGKAPALAHLGQSVRVGAPRSERTISEMGGATEAEGSDI
jgi:hypothetical protein